MNPLESYRVPSKSIITAFMFFKSIISRRCGRRLSPLEGVGCNRGRKASGVQPQGETSPSFLFFYKAVEHVVPLFVLHKEIELKLTVPAFSGSYAPLLVCFKGRFFQLE